MDPIVSRFKNQCVNCHMHSNEKQVSLYNEILSLLTKMNTKKVQKLCKE